MEATNKRKAVTGSSPLRSTLLYSLFGQVCPIEHSITSAYFSAGCVAGVLVVAGRHVFTAAPAAAAGWLWGGRGAF